MSNGISYYRDASFKIREATRTIARRIRDIEYLDVIGDPEELVNISKKCSLKLESLDGMKFNLLTNKWMVSKDKSVNYIAKFIKN